MTDDICRYCDHPIRRVMGSLGSAFGSAEGKEAWTTGEPGTRVIFTCLPSLGVGVHEPIQAPLEQIIAELREMVQEFA